MKNKIKRTGTNNNCVSANHILNRKEGNDQESIQLPRFYTKYPNFDSPSSKIPKGKKGAQDPRSASVQTLIRERERERERER